MQKNTVFHRHDGGGCGGSAFAAQYKCPFPLSNETIFAAPVSLWSQTTNKAGSYNLRSRETGVLNMRSLSCIRGRSLLSSVFGHYYDLFFSSGPSMTAMVLLSPGSTRSTARSPSSVSTSPSAPFSRRSLERERRNRGNDCGWEVVIRASFESHCIWKCADFYVKTWLGAVKDQSHEKTFLREKLQMFANFGGGGDRGILLLLRVRSAPIVSLAGVDFAIGTPLD